MRTFTIALGIMLFVATGSIAAETEDGTPHATRFNLGTILTGYRLSFAIHQLPLTTAHEGTHYLFAAAFGGKPKLHLLPSYVTMNDERHSRVLAMGYAEATVDLSSAQEAIVAIAPWVTQMLIVNPAIELAYRHRLIRPDTFGDKYMLAMLQLDSTSPLENTLSRSGDISRFAKAIHVPRFIVGGVIQFAYLQSYNRIVRARGHRDAGWVMYFRTSL